MSFTEILLLGCFFGCLDGVGKFCGFFGNGLGGFAGFMALFLAVLLGFFDGLIVVFWCFFRWFDRALLVVSSFFLMFCVFFIYECRFEKKLDGFHGEILLLF